jgi:hypothetical protein
MSKDELLRLVKLMQVKLDDTRSQLLHERGTNMELRSLMHLNALIRPDVRKDNFVLYRYLSHASQSFRPQREHREIISGHGPRHVTQLPPAACLIVSYEVVS